MITSIHVCPTHNCPMLIRYYKAGTPRQSFDGLVCPQCEARDQADRELSRTVNLIISDCEAFRRAVARQEPATIDRMTWEEREAWYSAFMVRKGYAIADGRRGC